MPNKDHRSRSRPLQPLHPKVAIGGMAGLVTTIVLWALAEAGLKPPPEVTAAITSLIIAAAGYRAPRAPDEAYSGLAWPSAPEVSEFAQARRHPAMNGGMEPAEPGR